MKTNAALDSSVLINFLKIKRLDLLKASAYSFHITNHVEQEIRDGVCCLNFTDIDYYELLRVEFPPYKPSHQGKKHVNTKSPLFPAKCSCKQPFTLT